MGIVPAEEAPMSKVHEVQSVKFARGVMVLRVDGKTARIPLATASPVLARATKQEREAYRVSPAGYGIHWPELDEDLSFQGLLRGDYGQHQNVEPGGAANGSTPIPPSSSAPASILTVPATSPN